MGKWSLPGGFVDPAQDKSLEDTANRKLLEKTGVAPPYLEQLHTIGNDDRDKRGWSVTVCYTALIAHQKCAPGIDTVSDARWVTAGELENIDLAFDHRNIIEQARERLRQKALYSIVPAYALPEKFTLPELQRIHEVFIGKPLAEEIISSPHRAGRSADRHRLETPRRRPAGGPLQDARTLRTIHVRQEPGGIAWTTRSPTTPRVKSCCAR